MILVFQLPISPSPFERAAVITGETAKSFAEKMDGVLSEKCPLGYRLCVCPKKEFAFKIFDDKYEIAQIDMCERFENTEDWANSVEHTRLSPSQISDLISNITKFNEGFSNIDESDE